MGPPRTHKPDFESARGTTVLPNAHSCSFTPVASNPRLSLSKTYLQTFLARVWYSAHLQNRPSTISEACLKRNPGELHEVRPVFRLVLVVSEKITANKGLTSANQAPGEHGERTRQSQRTLSRCPGYLQSVYKANFNGRSPGPTRGDTLCASHPWQVYLCSRKSGRNQRIAIWAGRKTELRSHKSTAHVL